MVLGPYVAGVAPLKENMGPFALGVGIATLAITYPFAAVAVGLLEPEEPIHWALRVFLVLFCTPFVLIGTGLVLGGIHRLVGSAVPGEAPFVLRALRYVVRQACKPRHVIGATPVILVAIQYWSVLATGSGFLGVDATLAERTILLEFFAIHATGFLGAAICIPLAGRLRHARWAAIALLCLLYLAVSAGQGWKMTVALFYLIGAKLGPFLLRPPDLHSGVTLALRWGFQMVVFLSVIGSFGGLESVRAGAVYWTAIAVAELLGMMEARLFFENEKRAET